MPVKEWQAAVELLKVEELQSQGQEKYEAEVRLERAQAVIDLKNFFLSEDWKVASQLLQYLHAPVRLGEYRDDEYYLCYEGIACTFVNDQTLVVSINNFTVDQLSIALEVSFKNLLPRIIRTIDMMAEMVMKEKRRA